MSTVAHSSRSDVRGTTVSRLTSAFSKEKALVGLALGLAAIPLLRPASTGRSTP